MAGVAVLLGALALASTACDTLATSSPPEHTKRLDKAAGLAEIRITCTKDMWDRTLDSGRPVHDDDNTFDGVKPRKLNGAQGKRGLIEVTLTGPQLVEYLRRLDYEAHGGFAAQRDDAPLARRMYNALAPIVDRVEIGHPPTAVPRAVVDDSAVAAGSTPSPETER
jgi:hypothetical protein